LRTSGAGSCKGGAGSAGGASVTGNCARAVELFAVDEACERSACSSNRRSARSWTEMAVWRARPTRSLQDWARRAAKVLGPTGPSAWGRRTGGQRLLSAGPDALCPLPAELPQPGAAAFLGAPAPAPGPLLAMTPSPPLRCAIFTRSNVETVPGMDSRGKALLAFAATASKALTAVTAPRGKSFTAGGCSPGGQLFGLDQAHIRSLACSAISSQEGTDL